ncbi:GDSL esterase/lipase At1g71250 isoform X2 [Ricinus communis]|uniref:GDSL esterase/lipase At1g71250 isoform X2 n=1 Tax=Ricinus communis TaxID=3988 RepID=UPI000D69A0FC|nr:GDSL esterase/lipase At1g71250 isoform X2 [Ricinus communis]|eukprot:XP_025012908.1 GDSL esterase/lipase At1g71250 isoform X2 [Ricinus communis]
MELKIIAVMLGLLQIITSIHNNNNIHCCGSGGVVMGSQIPAMFVFGDSLLDDGDLIGLPPLPPFAATATGITSILNGVNYASAAAGILDDTGKNLGDRYTLRQQVQNFKTSVTQLKAQMDDNKLSEYLGKSLALINIGSNDYLNNYLMPSLYSTSFTYNPRDYAHLLIASYTDQILVLHSLGVKKFFLTAVGPLGCIPNQLATGLAPPGNCISFVNDWVEIFNMQLKSLVDQLNHNHSDSIFVYGNTYAAFNDVLDNPSSYGFEVTDRGCCGIGRNEGLITCLPFAIPCFNRDKYVFWDAYHPTQAFNRIMAQRAYSGPPSDCYPINIKQMALI